MHVLRRLLRALAAALALGLLAAPPVLAGSTFDKLFREYRSTGGVKACKHSTSELQTAKNQVPPDITQYAPDFPAALQAALEARAHGVCGGAAAAAATGPIPGSQGSAGGAPGTAIPVASGTAPGATPAPIPSADGISPIVAAASRAGGGGASSAPLPLIALAVVLVLFALVSLWWTATTLRGRGDPLRAGAAGHALGEVRMRAGGTLRDFADWLRIGR